MHMSSVFLSRFSSVVAASILCFAAVAAAQVPALPSPTGAGRAEERHPAFEVISIRRDNADSTAPQFGLTPDGFHSINLPLIAIFQTAYAPANSTGPLLGDRIAGAPEWLHDERYDVTAKVGEPDFSDWQKPDRKQAMLRSMLQAMLTERCEVVAHYENKEVPVYELVVAKGGPKFKQAEATDPALLKQNHPGGHMMSGTASMAVQSAEGIHFYAISMGTLAKIGLSASAGRPVVDKTGLTGSYDIFLPATALPHQPGAPLADDQSIFSALPEALGLRLVPAKDQVEILVIDHVERPTEN